MIKRVLVYAYGNMSHKATFKAAANYAVQNDCELTGVFVTPDYMNYSTVYSNNPIGLAEHFYNLQKDFEKKSHAEFDDVLKEIKCKGEWHELSELDAERKPGLYTDLIFVSQPDTESSIIFNDTDFVDHLVMETGIPTVIVPADWDTAVFAKHPVLGWKEAREAVSAVRHAMPIMQAADKVDIVTVVSKFDDDKDLINGIEISAYLADHNVECSYTTIVTADNEKNESDTLARHAEVHACDLIIIGAYSHSRLREIILGGVTRGLLRKAKVPVLMAH